MSISEDHGLALINANIHSILSIGISTAGDAEIRMASLAPEAQIIATTLDKVGAALVVDLLRKNKLDERIIIRTEDIAEKNPAIGNTLFDFVYARLVLHYLSEESLQKALANIHQAMQKDALLYVVVRSIQSFEAKQKTNTYDPISKLTTYEVASKGSWATRYFHSEDSIVSALQESGFQVKSSCEYDEKLSPNFDRTGSFVDNSVIEVIARKV